MILLNDDKGLTSKDLFLYSILLPNAIIPNSIERQNEVSWHYCSEDATAKKHSGTESSALFVGSVRLQKLVMLAVRSLTTSRAGNTSMDNKDVRTHLVA